MRQITVGLLLLGAMIGFIAPSGATEPLRPVQAQGQAPNQGRGRGQNQAQAQPVEPFRIIGNIYWVGGEYGSYLITTPAGHILHDTGTNEMHGTIVSNVTKLGFDVK